MELLTDMKENMVMATFNDVKEAKRAYDFLKKKNDETSYEVLQVVLVQKKNGRINVLDQHAEIFTELGKTMIGGVVGVVLGVLIGPLAGFVLGGVGAMIGSGFDITEQAESETMLYQMYSRLYKGDIAILAIVQENNELEINSSIGKNAENIYRWDAAEIREEAEYATDLRDELFKQGKKEMRKEKSAARKEKIKEYKENIKEEFEKLKRK